MPVTIKDYQNVNYECKGIVKDLSFSIGNAFFPKIRRGKIKGDFYIKKLVPVLSKIEA